MRSRSNSQNSVVGARVTSGVVGDTVGALVGGRVTSGVVGDTTGALVVMREVGWLVLVIGGATGEGVGGTIGATGDTSGFKFGGGDPDGAEVGANVGKMGGRGYPAVNVTSSVALQARPI